MVRDKGLEALLQDELGPMAGVTDKAMFGGWAWLLEGHLFCGARDDGMLLRLGKGLDAWALEIEGVMPMLSRGKHMHGWVRADASVYGDDELRQKLIAASLEFVRTLPKK
jgi:TfoX N-terminal domain